MTDKDDPKARALRLIQRIDHEAVARMPPSQSGLTPGQLIVGGVFLSAWANYRGIGYLVRHDLAEPAMILCRSLVYDAVRLAYFAAHSDQLECLAVRFNHESLGYEEGFLKATQAAGEDIGDSLAHLNTLRAEVRSRADTLGMRKIGRLPDVSQMAREIASAKTRLHTTVHSQIVHTGRVAIGRRLRSVEGSTFRAELASEQSAIMLVCYQAIEGFCNAWLSAALLLAWGEPTVGEINRFRDEAFAEWRGVWADWQEAPGARKVRDTSPLQSST